jgi:hypothetical protein
LTRGARSFFRGGEVGLFHGPVVRRQPLAPRGREHDLDCPRIAQIGQALDHAPCRALVDQLAHGLFGDTG